MTPDEVIKAIFKGWSEEVRANKEFWRVQYIKQLKIHSGPDLAAGWQRCLENNPGGFPPAPDVIAAMCRKLKHDGQPVVKTNTWEPPREHYPLSEKEIANLNRLMDAANRRINEAKANAETMDDKLAFGVHTDEAFLRVATKAFKRHQKAVEQQR